MWMVNVKTMCRKHLLGEHVECHMIVGSINKSKNLEGFVDRNCLQFKSIYTRHNALAKEMIRRGYNHKSPIEKINWLKGNKVTLKVLASKVNQKLSEKDLYGRCKDCRDLAQKLKKPLAKLF